MRSRVAWLMASLFSGAAALGAQTYEVFHSLEAPAQNPYPSLVLGPDGNFYGTTFWGGTASDDCEFGCGIVFRLDAEGNQTTVHEFSYSEGAFPVGAVFFASSGDLYGTTAEGGSAACHCGTVYRIDSNGTYQVVHDFDRADGDRPLASLIEPSPGELWGTTFYGGDGCDLTPVGCGTVFRMQLDGDLQTMHSFNGDDGRGPRGLLLADDGNIYFTTHPNGNGDGYVYRISTNGNLSPPLYHFTGVQPGDTLIQGSSGELIGVTNAELFRLSLDGDYQTIHPFPGDASEGLLPASPVLEASDGFFYVVMSAGLGLETGWGVINRIDGSGNLTRIHAFDRTTTDVLAPQSGLIQTPDGRLYGTAFAGGEHGRGGVYRVTLPGPPRFFCPDSGVRRDQMSVFLLKTEHGAGFAPPECQGGFGDVACPSQFADWIEQLAAEGITAGCAGGNYCPLSAVTRAQMAVFLLKTEHGAAYLPPPCSGVFPDVPCPSLFADWIEQLAAEGITGGCAGGGFCPDLPVTRAQMAVFLLKMEHGGAYQPPPCESLFADVTCPSLFAPWIEQLFAEGITAGCAGPP